MTWGAVEMWLIIIAGSVAPLWPLIKSGAAKAKSHIKKTNDSYTWSRGRYGHSDVDESLPSDKEEFQRLGSATGPAGGIEMHTKIWTNEDVVETTRPIASPEHSFDPRTYARPYTKAYAGPTQKV